MALPTTDPAVNPDLLNFAPHNTGTTWLAFLQALVTAATPAATSGVPNVSGPYLPERDRLYQLVSELDRVLTVSGIAV